MAFDAEIAYKHKITRSDDGSRRPLYNFSKVAQYVWYKQNKSDITLDV